MPLILLPPNNYAPHLLLLLLLLLLQGKGRACMDGAVPLLQLLEEKCPI